MWNKPIPLFAPWTIFVSCICSCFRCSEWYRSVMCVDPPVTWRARCLFCLVFPRRWGAAPGCCCCCCCRPADAQLHYLWAPASYHSRTAMLHLLHSWFIYPDFLLCRSLCLSLSQSLPVLSWGLFFFFPHLSLRITEDLINGNSAFEGEIITAGTLTIKLLLSFHHFLQLMSYLNWNQLLFFFFFSLHHIINSSWVARSVIFHSQAAQAASE